ncbi:MAG: EAL domain-containing protein [Solirubrobacterales bacterium]|nr:EAL domain-containing protein [Solirubrobacterales bacterium]
MDHADDLTSVITPPPPGLTSRSRFAMHVGGADAGRHGEGEELVAVRDLLQATLDAFPSHVAVIDEAGEILATNRAWKEFAVGNGGPPPGIEGNYLAACDAAVGDELAARAACGLRAVAAGEQELFQLEYPCHGPEVERWFLLRASRCGGQGPARVVVAHDNITERHVATQEVLTQAALLNEVDVSVIAVDPGRAVTHWNRKAEQMYGWARLEAVGRDIDELVVPADGRSRDAEHAALVVAGLWEDTYTARLKDGSTFPVEVRGRTMLDAAGGLLGATSVSVDISARVASERALVEARDYMRAVVEGMGQGLLTLDVEGCISYANAAAEALLGWSPEELQGRDASSLLLARSGVGEEVPDDLMRRAGTDGVPVRVDDATFLRRDGAELPVAYTAAPFETVTGVHGCVVLFEDNSERRTVEDGLRRDVLKLSWITRIQDALTEDRFVLYAQPIVDLQSGTIVQHELLLRMREPDGCIVGPGDFLPIAEKYGLIGEIDRWVVEQATALAASGHPVEVNVSARSVGDRAFAQHIERCLTQSGADPSLIVFEVTETALVEDASTALAFAEQVRALGSKLALDDFGTGFGTFTYLKQLPVDYLKIDIEFVRDLTSNRASHHVVQAVVALAHAFGLRTIAEGVEDAGTLELLGELGVDQAQGYFIARPAPLAFGEHTIDRSTA